MGEAEGWSKQETEQTKREFRAARELAYSNPDFKSRGRSSDEVLHPVTLTEGFWMLETEITNLQYYIIEKNEKHDFLGNNPYYPITWNGAQSFCKTCSQLGMKVQLPTEAQWEYACRAGTKGPFAGDFEEMTWHFGNSDRHAQNVRTKTPNQWGLYDMHGNVAEWVADWCGTYPSKPTKDPKGPEDGDKKMTRGGSWGSPKHFCRSALRGGLEPDQHTVGLGFRCVLNED